MEVLYVVDSGFHPTMVLAQRSYKFDRSRGRLVSIPLWFSLNLKTKSETRRSRSFHPTMVLAQQEFWRWSICNFLVSIPLWFSLNDNRKIKFIRKLPFPSHYGSRSTCEYQSVDGLERVVSIPLWFSLNEYERLIEFVVKFPSHYGSRSTQDSRLSFFFSGRVSIPLWFSLNQRNIAIVPPR